MVALLAARIIVWCARISSGWSLVVLFEGYPYERISLGLFRFIKLGRTILKKCLTYNVCKSLFSYSKNILLPLLKLPTKREIESHFLSIPEITRKLTKFLPKI